MRPGGQGSPVIEAFLRHTVLRSALPLALTLAVLLSGCLGGFGVSESPAPTPAFQPEVFFAGATHGDGTLAVRGRADRRFTVASTGRQSPDDLFVLEQEIRFVDGEVQRRNFFIRRLDAHRYAGTLSGAAGPVTARADGNSFHLRYRMGKASTMEQWLYLQPDGRTAFNRATVRVLGLPVAHLSETIRRE
ncbi:hypothetical protein BH11PSE14_BH11PSE14_22030 [soil metagenome]